MLSFLPGSVRGWLTHGALRWPSWEVGVAPTEVLCGSRPHGMGNAFAMQLLLVPAEMKRNSSSRTVKSGMFVFEKLVLAHLIFWL